MTVFMFDYTDKSPEEVSPLFDLIYYFAGICVNTPFNITVSLQIKCAQSAHLRLKTLRHPNVLKYIDGIEVSQLLYTS